MSLRKDYIQIPVIWLVIAAFVIVAGVGIYFVLGRFTAKPETAMPTAAPHAPMMQPGQKPPGSVEEMVARLAKRMEQEPNNAEGWVMLGRSYSALNRFDAAVDAYRRASKLMPDNADVMADYADVMAMSKGGELTGEPEEIALRAIKIDSKHPKALALAGTASFRRGDYPEALSRWEKALSGLPADSDMRHSLEKSIADAKSKLGKNGK